ncbi:MAG: ferrous iron transport protein B [Chloroflexi bacterium]|nr:ferrous iron transport protein B [Chloroflexota bacterium]
MTKTIALAGNPNVGKSTLFNALTDSHQHVGNWPGKTVEKKEGRLQIGNQEIIVVDLPGTYSLTAYSIEEIIARDYIVNDKPNAVVAVVNAANLDRNLYLVTQIIELGIPVIVALNMTDVARRRGIAISLKGLSERLGGIPVVETVGNRSEGLEDLIDAITLVMKHPHTGNIQTSFRGILKEEIDNLKVEIEAQEVLKDTYRPDWLATKLLENDQVVIDKLETLGAAGLLERALNARERIEIHSGEDPEILIADQRYQFVDQVIDSAVERPRETIITRSERIDDIVTHRIWGLPIFFLLMWFVFQFTSNVSVPFLDWVDVFINEFIFKWAGRVLELAGLGDSWISSLITDGVIAGVGGVLVFVPVLLFLYLALGIMEDSGYMARAAFVMDRVMRAMGLHGKSFLPMIIGFGCTVPAVYSTRTLEYEKDRKLTAFLATFMSCGARLPVYVVFGAAFFGASSGSLVFAMYILGIVVALITGYVMKNTIYQSQPPAPFVMELPPYRIPRPKDVWNQMWERTKGFLVKSGTVILSVSIVLWLLMSIPAHQDKGPFNQIQAGDSLFGRISGLIAPIFNPAGFGSWQTTGSLVTGILAKEVIISSMSQVYAVESNPIGELSFSFRDDIVSTGAGFGKAALLTIQETINIFPRTINLVPFLDVGELDFFHTKSEPVDYTRLEGSLIKSFAKSAGSPEAGPIAAVAFNVFVLLYIPCVSAISAMRLEFGRRWMWAQISYTFIIAWVGAVTVFQVGKLIYL